MENPRAVWADVAKGVCILLVVLWHTVNKHYLQVDWQAGGAIPAMWGFFGDQLMTLRMPLFFTISGMFAVSAYHRPWRQAVSLIATVFGLSAAPLVARWTHVGAALSWLGRRTLPIYVIHMPILALLHMAVAAPLSHASPAAQTVLAATYPLIVTALLVATCLLIEYGLKAARATWLFDLPTRRALVDSRRQSFSWGR